jgi:translation initiation factor IF-2
MNVEQFAKELKVQPAMLIEQLSAAGVSVKGPDDALTDQDKARLLDYLRLKHGAKEPKGKITLTRKQTSEIKTADDTGKSRTIPVEVRKKRTLVKRETPHGAEETPAPVEVQEKPAAASPVLDEREVQARQAEEKRQAELRAIQEAELKRKQEREAATRKQEQEAQQAEAAKAQEAQAAAEAPAAQGEKTAEAAKAAKDVKPTVKPKTDKVAPKKPAKEEQPAGKKGGLKTRGSLESEEIGRAHV